MEFLLDSIPNPFVLLSKQIKNLRETDTHPYPAGLKLKVLTRDKLDAVMTLEPHGFRIKLIDGEVAYVARVPSFVVSCGNTAQVYGVIDRATGAIRYQCLPPSSTFDTIATAVDGDTYFVPLEDFMEWKYEYRSQNETVYVQDVVNYFIFYNLIKLKEPESMRMRARGVVDNPSYDYSQSPFQAPKVGKKITPFSSPVTKEDSSVPKIVVKFKNDN